MLMVRRDFVTVHKQTVLGPLWHIVNPILTALTFTLIFGRVVQLPTDGLPPILFYMSGTVAWNYFTSCFFKTSNSLAGNAGLFGKVYFHRLVVPIASVVSALVSFAIQLAIFAVMAVAYYLKGAPIHPGAWFAAIPLLIVMLAGYGLALGLLASALTARYRDLGQLLGFGTQLLMFATPIIYPLSYVAAKYHWLVLANPLASIVETFRAASLGRGTPQVTGLLSGAAVLVVLMTVGIAAFTRTERTFLDTV
jgi:lipopolysaccharide transport system permease protein